MNESKFGLNDVELNQIVKIFTSFEKIEEVILFGSRALGNYKIYSDIDLVIKGKEFNFSQQLLLEQKLDDLMLPYKMDVLLFQTIQNQDLIDHISRVGKLIYKLDQK